MGAVRWCDAIGRRAGAEYGDYGFSVIPTSLLA
jgi:hypothetical protein